MNLILSLARRSAFPSWMAVVFLVAVLTGCNRGQVKVYQLSNDNSSSPSAPANATAPVPEQNENGAGQPQLQWTLPAGWTQVPPGQMSVASFKVTGQNGAEADVSVAPLPGSAGGENANVNRWRGQVGLAAATPDEVAKMAESVQIGSQPGKLYDLAGQSFDSGNAKRILGVIDERDGMTWFFKMMGDASLVAQQKPEFIAFLKSLKFTAGTAQSSQLPPGHPAVGSGDMNTPMMPPSSTSEAKPVWTVPAGWQVEPAGQFVTAEYSIAGTNGQATVDAAELAGDGGGTLANVNRWRGQIGLDPVDETALAKLTTTVSVNGGQATLVDMTGADANGQPTRLIAAIVPVGDQTWFYKLMGDAKTVASQKDAFTKFVQTARYSDAR